MTLLDDVKFYLRIDGNDEDESIQRLIKSADTVISNAVGTVDQTSELYTLAVKFLVSHWYENREVVGKADNLPFSLESIIYQLKYCGGDTS
jgi:uncharacterized phage protein (predicted DNA packaging)